MNPSCAYVVVFACKSYDHLPGPINMEKSRSIWKRVTRVAWAGKRYHHADWCAKWGKFNVPSILYATLWLPLMGPVAIFLLHLIEQQPHEWPLSGNHFCNRKFMGIRDVDQNRKFMGFRAGDHSICTIIDEYTIGVINLNLNLNFKFYTYFMYLIMIVHLFSVLILI